VTVATLDPRLRGGALLREGDGGSARLLRIACSRSLRERSANALSSRVFHYPFFVTALIGYRQLVARERFDVAHVETAFPLGGVTTFPGSPPMRQVLTPQGEDLIVEREYDYGHRRFAAPRWLVRRSLDGAELVRCISPMMTDLVRGVGGADGRCVMVPCNVRSDAIPADVVGFRAAARAEVRATIGLAPETPIVLAFGRLHPFKGIDVMIRALGLLRRAGEPVVGVICGGAKVTRRFADYRDDLAALATEENLGEALRFHGEVPNDAAPRWLAAADVVVVPSTTESFNRVTIEAAAVGTPVVVTRTTGIAAFVTGEEWAVVAESREPDVLAAGISKALTLGKAAVASGPAFARHFLPDEIGPRLVELYRRAIEIAPGTGGRSP
jgi:glycosyltransferase involved in cell wall biosynthesis